MAVDAVYLFDEKMQIRRAVVWGVYELLQDEATYELDAEIDAKYEAKPGESLGFSGIDGEFLLFEIDKAEIDDKRGVLMITATYAPVKELTRLIAREIRLTGANVQTAAQAALEGSDWTLGQADAGGRTADLNKYYETRWKALKEIALQWQARVVPRYIFDGRRVTGKIVDVTPRGNVYRGRLFEGASGTSQIYVTYTGSPVTRLYGIGKAIGEEDPPSCVTIRDAVWSKAKGDPADKPAGQDYIEDLEAIEAYGHGREAVFQDKTIEDPMALTKATWEELQKLKRPKISGTATTADMEHIPGHEHKIARMYDLVWVRTRRGVDVSATIINIKRNHLRRGRTKIFIGEEADDSGLIKKIAKMSSDVRDQGNSRDSTRNQIIMARQLIQLNADTIQMNARLIEANAEIIQLTASNLKRFEDGTDERLGIAELTLFGDKDSAQAGLVARMSNAEGEISRAALTLYGDAESAKAGLAAEFNTLSASYATFKSTAEGSFADIGVRFGENEAAISAVADELGSKVTIEALEIELKGYVTASKLQAEFTNFESGISDTLYVSALSANTFECADLSIGSNGITLKRHGNMSGGTISEGATYKNYVVYESGVRVGSVNIPATWKFTPTWGSDIYYLSWQ